MTRNFRSINGRRMSLNQKATALPPRPFTMKLPAVCRYLLPFLLLVAKALPADSTSAPVAPNAVVALDGSGNFTSVQEAISSAPMNTDPAGPRWVILVKPGTYHERIYVQRERGHMLVLGEDAARTIITFDLHANLPGPDGRPITTFRTETLQIDGDGMIWENITIANGAGKPGPRPGAPAVSQAVALRADGDQLVFRHCRFLGWQDTILVNRGRHYFEDCYIEGSVDFIFGGATAYFNRCHIHCVGNGYITAASTPKGVAHGLIFADCRITGADGVMTYLGRPWREFAQTVFLRTEMSAVVRPTGWDNWGKTSAEPTTYYAEYASTGPGADAAHRVPWRKTLAAEDVALLTPDQVLAGDDRWNPLATKTSAAPSKVRIVLIGDSTVAEHNGWGPGLRHFLTNGAECVDVALNGRSSKSYRTEGHWEPALALKGNYYLIQFGHNDQPGKGPDRETDPSTTYPENLRRYVDEVRAIGAQPILVTSLARRNFDPAGSGHIVDTLGPYADAVKKVAAEKHVPLIDLHARSLAYCEKLGPDGCAPLNPRKANGTADTTHLDAAGSVVFARLVAEDLRTAVPALAPFLLSAAPEKAEETPPTR